MLNSTLKQMLPMNTKASCCPWLWCTQLSDWVGPFQSCVPRIACQHRSSISFLSYLLCAALGFFIIHSLCMFTSSLGTSLSHCWCLRHYQNVNKKMILAFPGKLFSTSDCTSNTQFTLYHSTAWFVQALPSSVIVMWPTWTFEQTWGLHPHSSPPPRKTLHIIKGLVKIALCPVPGLISWRWSHQDEISVWSHQEMKAEERSRHQATFPVWEDTSGQGHPAWARQQEENSSSAVLLAQPSTERTRATNSDASQCCLPLMSCKAGDISHRYAKMKVKCYQSQGSSCLSKPQQTW